jgi:hypothetical protein
VCYSLIKVEGVIGVTEELHRDLSTPEDSFTHFCLENMKIKAIKQGNTLQLFQEINCPDGQEILIDIAENELNQHQSSVTWEDFQEVIGAWKDDEEIIEIFKTIDQERHQDMGREIEF